jgi:hypothetical protein
MGDHDPDDHHHGRKGLTPEQEYRRKMRQRNGAIMIEGNPNILRGPTPLQLSARGAFERF